MTYSFGIILDSTRQMYYIEYFRIDQKNIDSINLLKTNHEKH